jgi:hypothetical protein
LDPDTDEGGHRLGLLARYDARLCRSFAEYVRSGRNSGPISGDALDRTSRVWNDLNAAE